MSLITSIRTPVVAFAAVLAVAARRAEAISISPEAIMGMMPNFTHISSTIRNIAILPTVQQGSLGTLAVVVLGLGLMHTANKYLTSSPKAQPVQPLVQPHVEPLAQPLMQQQAQVAAGIVQQSDVDDIDDASDAHLYPKPHGKVAAAADEHSNSVDESDEASQSSAVNDDASHSSAVSGDGENDDDVSESSSQAAPDESSASTTTSSSQVSTHGMKLRDRK